MVIVKYAKKNGIFNAPYGLLAHLCENTIIFTDFKNASSYAPQLNIKP